MLYYSLAVAFFTIGHWRDSNSRMMMPWMRLVSYVTESSKTDNAINDAFCYQPLRVAES